MDSRMRVKFSDFEYSEGVSSSLLTMEFIPGIDGPPHPSHLLLAFYLASGFVVIRSLLDRFICPRIATRLKRTQATRYEAIRATIARFSDCIWKLLYEFVAESIVVKITYNQPWFSVPSAHSKGRPEEAFEVLSKLFYLGQCGFYIFSVATMLLWETIRVEMISHHVISVVLIGFSYITRGTTYRFFRTGIVVLALNEASEILMEASEVFKYCGDAVAGSILSGFLPITCLVLRLISFPLWIIKSLSVDVLKVWDASNAYDISLSCAFITLVLMLLGFHVYLWFLKCSRQWSKKGNRGRRIGEGIRSGAEDE